MNMRRLTLSRVALALCLACLPAAASFAQDKTPAIDGYDPVAYFTEKRPMQGKSAISHDWDEKRFLFANAKHRDLFAANPERYEPQFGGHCAAAVSKGRKTKADPTIWRIVDGKLYVFSMQQPSEEAYAKAAVLAQVKWKDMKQ